MLTRAFVNLARPANERFAPNGKLLYNRAIEAEGWEKAALYERFSLVYDALMRGVDYDGWADYLDRLLRGFGACQGASVLECACGTGEITLRLAALGYRVVASDVSADMLRVAQEKARKKGLAVPFVEQDMRCLSAHRPADAVLAACDGVNYLLSAGLTDSSRARAKARRLAVRRFVGAKLKTFGCNMSRGRRDLCVPLAERVRPHCGRRMRLVLQGSAYRAYRDARAARAHAARDRVR